MELGTISSEGGITTSADVKEPEQPTLDLVETLEKMDMLRVQPKRPSGAQRKQALKAELEAKGIAWDPAKWRCRKPKGKGTQEENAENPRKSTKRSCSDGSAPSPSGILKKAKQSEGPEEGGASTSTKETYKELLTTYKMAVIPENFPTNKLSEVQIEKLQESVVEAFENLKDGNFPQFTGSYGERGALILSCANEATMKWVMGKVPQLKPWEGPNSPWDREQRYYEQPRYSLRLRRCLRKLTPKTSSR
ncbi:hypothetical protein C0J52_11650 [Blattella germanica]|nr:hypothetical protein C0J52_11650 [Blattella germanica]